MLQRFARLPEALLATRRLTRLGPSGIPAMLVHPDWDSGRSVPVVLWIHGRTASKETDPGRYLRFMRAGIGVCAVDLPGHGERYLPELQDPGRTLDFLAQMIEEIDEVIAALTAMPEFDTQRMGIGGMSSGGMVTLARLCRDHPFRCASVEAATGSWQHQRDHIMFNGCDEQLLAALDPSQHLDGWRPIPIQAFHSLHDKIVTYAGQAAFIDTLRQRYDNQEHVQFVVYEHCGSPWEHVGFGEMTTDAKHRQWAFFARYLWLDE